MKTVAVKIGTETELIGDGSVVIAAITSCTNTSNPSVMIGAGILARKARERGLNVKPWVKTSLAPGSKVVTDYLERSGLLKDLEALRFHVVGYGCTSCIGNSGPLPAPVAKAIDENNLVVASVLSGNRNFEARVHPQVKMNFLMSPILVVAYAIAGRVDIDLNNEPIGYDPNLEPVYLKDIWPSEDEIRTTMTSVITPEDFRRSYSTIFEGDEQWKALDAPEGKTFRWDPSSTYIKEAPFFKDLKENPDRPADIVNSKVLLWLGDSVTTDHISPAGSFKEDSAAGKYLLSKGVEKKDFNSYGSRRGNDEVMVRGTFANVRIKNRIATREGGYSVHLPTGIEDTVFDTAMRYKAENTPLIVLAGKEYGSGSSRDWAAKGTYLLGIKAVIAESYERIHRSNLVGMGVMPLQFLDGQNADSLGLTGRETFTITGISEGLEPGKILKVIAKDDSSKEKTFEVICRLDSKIEIEYYTHGGILQYVLRQFLAS
jgi:aconitate hydratase